MRMKKLKICCLIIIFLFLCCCSSKRSTWTPKFSQTESINQILSTCDTTAAPVYSQKSETNNQLDPFYKTLMNVEAILSLPPLSVSELPNDVKEIRVAIGSGNFFPQHLLRLVVDGNTVKGDLYAWWPSSINNITYDRKGKEIPSMVQFLADKCKEGNLDPNSQISTCRYCFKYHHSWSDVLKKLEKEKIWDLPDEDELPPIDYYILDGDWILVQLRSGNFFRSYCYSNSIERDLSEAKSAYRMFEYITELQKNSIK